MIIDSKLIKKTALEIISSGESHPEYGNSVDLQVMVKSFTRVLDMISDLEKHTRWDSLVKDLQEFQLKDLKVAIEKRLCQKSTEKKVKIYSVGSVGNNPCQGDTSYYLDIEVARSEFFDRVQSMDEYSNNHDNHHFSLDMFFVPESEVSKFVGVSAEE